jgi:peptidoglycan hydrolase-like protein with peptidoglycan-binding domain
MQALRERSSKGGRRRWPWVLAASVVVLGAAAGGITVALTGNRGGTAAVSCGSGASCSSGGSSSPASAASARTLSVSSVTPSKGATGVASNTTVAVQFSGAVHDGTDPTITPAVAGSWQATGHELVFTPAAPFIPYEKYTVAIPGGSSGVEGTTGAHLAKTVTTTFTVADGSTLRLQQLLAQLGYLPLSYAPPAGTPAPQDLAMPQPGTLAWRWAGLPAALTSQWVQGGAGAVTRGAVMMFETQNGLAVDGIAGPQVWSTLVADVVAKKANTQPLTYVLVTKTLPEHLTAWVNGTLQFPNIPVNTGVPGATTTDGTYQVFEHVQASDMKGTNVTGSTYNDPTVPWASYFNGGDALHGFPRAAYGFPQSNGCVEMQITTAGHLWPYTPIGTVVTVQGPPS